MKVVVDSSVWVAHFKQSNAALRELLAWDMALSHPVVLGEIACGTPPNRKATLGLLANVEPAAQASMTETLTMIERHQFMGRGCGLSDMQLLASTLITPDAKLWTLDKRLAELARELKVQYES